MTNRCTPEFFKALDSLKQRCPQAFIYHAHDNRDLEDFFPPLDPDVKVVMDFRNAIREADWERRNSVDVWLKADIAYCYRNYYGKQETARYLDIPLSEVRDATDRTPELQRIYEKARHDFRRVVVYDKVDDEYMDARDKYEAAKKCHTASANIGFYLSDRHCKYWIGHRYKVKRKVWFDEDNGM